MNFFAHNLHALQVEYINIFLFQFDEPCDEI